jgi:hypothetical protein
MVEISGQIVIVRAKIGYPALSRSIDDKAAGVRLGVQDHVFRAR